MLRALVRDLGLLRERGNDKVNGFESWSIH
jgi:hypothetical protein